MELFSVQYSHWEARDQPIADANCPAAEVFLGQRQLCAGEEGKHGCQQPVQIPG